MRIGRTIPPAAAPLSWTDLWNGIIGACSPERSVQMLEEEIRRHFAVRHAFLVSSGTAAMTLTLMALKSLSSRTEVVLPAYTCFSVPAAILKARLRPTLCDIGASTFDFDHRLLDQTLNENTLCVIAHHLFGSPCDIERIAALCRSRGIFVVEDAAQAMGVKVEGRPLGTLGDVGIFSLGRGKNITCGSGGIIVTNSPVIGEAIAQQYRQLEVSPVLTDLRDFVRLVFMKIFIRPRLYWIPAALPFLRLGQTIFPTAIPLARLSGMKAGLLRNWRKRLNRSNRTRSEIAGYFADRLRMPLSHGHPYLRVPLFVRSAATRERIYSLSQRRGLGLSVAYPTAINEIPEIRAAVNGKRFPAARKAAATLLTIPTHQWLSETDKRDIAELCRDAAHV